MASNETVPVENAVSKMFQLKCISIRYILERAFSTSTVSSEAIEYLFKKVPATN